MTGLETIAGFAMSYRDGRQVVRTWIAAFLALLVLGSAPGHSQTTLTPGDLKRVNALSGNTIAWAVLRKAVKLGLTDAGLTEIANQNDSVDTISTILALEDPEARLSPILAGAARGGIMAAANSDLVASLGLDGSRPKGMGCLIFGHSPQERSLFADLMKMSEAERTNCASHYGRIRDYWLQAVAKFLRPPDAIDEAMVDVRLGPASGTLASARSILIAGETVHEVAYFLRRTTRFARPLILEGASCGTPVVDIDQNSGQLVLCYELLAELVNPIAASVGGQTQ